MELWNKYHKGKFGEKWITDSELSFTENILHIHLDIYRRVDKISIDSKSYIEKLFSIADSLSEEMEKINGMEDATKETIKQFVARDNIPYNQDIYDFIDILNTIDDEKNRSANCLGKTTLFVCLAEMVDHELFSKLRVVTIPSHVFVRVKSSEGDRDIETTATYKKMESKSKGKGIEREVKFIIPTILYGVYYETLDEKILDEISDNFPTYDLALAEKGRRSIERNNIPEAEKYIDRALEIFPDEPDYLKLKGDVEYKKGNKREARKYYEKAMSSKYADRKIKADCLKSIVKIDRELNFNVYIQG